MRSDTRRRSPLWVRQLPSATIHGMACQFNRERRSEDLSARQEWLYDALISELEHRHRSARPFWTRCSCELCLPPFSD